MWASRSQTSYNEGIQPFVDALIEVFEQAANGRKFKKYKRLELDEEIGSDINVEIGKNVRRLRMQKGISLSKMAELLGVNIDYYHDIERGAAWMRTVDIKDMANVLGVKSSAVMPF